MSMTGLERPLAGCMVGLSISESEDSELRGFPAEQINRVTVHVVGALFGQGVGVVFGHDWRPDGVMQTVHSLAREMQPSSADAGRSTPPLLQNLLPWPDQPMLAEREREQLSAALLVQSAGLPDELWGYVNMLRANPLEDAMYPYLRARALTHMRRQLDARTHARICIGGRSKGGQGRFPGVIEEALLTFSAGKPLYLVGLLGGATRQVIEAIKGGAMPSDFCAPLERERVYHGNASRLESLESTRPDRVTSRDAVWRAFHDAGLPRLAAGNRLTAAENDELFHTPSIEHAIRLILVGLSRVCRPTPSKPPAPE
jgi:hypothetical protein